VKLSLLDETPLGYRELVPTLMVLQHLYRFNFTLKEARGR